MTEKKKNFNQLDPFADSDESYETRDIKNSKSRESGRRVEIYKKNYEAKTKKSEKKSFFKKIVKFFKDLPDRGDKRKIYLRLIIIPIVVLSFIAVIVFYILPLVDKLSRDSYLSELDLFINEDDFNSEESIKKRESYKNTLTKRIAELDNSEVRNEYIDYLVMLYESEEKTDYAKIAELLRMKLNYEGIDSNEKAITLYNLIEIYYISDENEKLRESVREFLALPDNESRIFQGVSITDMKKILKEQYSNVQ